MTFLMAFCITTALFHLNTVLRRILEMSENRPCPCGSDKPRYSLTDAAGIFCAYVCEKCEDAKRATYNPRVFDPDSDYAASGAEEDLQEWDDEEEEFEDPYDDGFGIAFADPGGNSALRAATKDNPRNLPCPNCGKPDRLTPADRNLGYQCDECADKAERGWD